MIAKNQILFATKKLMKTQDKLLTIDMATTVAPYIGTMNWSLKRKKLTH